MKLDNFINWNKEKENKGNLRKRALKGLILFLLCMILLTLLSRAATNMIIPQAEVCTAGAGALKYSFDVAGTVEENQIFAVTTVEGIRVAQIFVHEGDRIKADDPLFSVDPEDLTEQIKQKNEEIEKLDLSIQDTKNQKAREQQDWETAMDRAKEDYDTEAQTQNELVDRTYEAMVEAENRLTEFRGMLDRMNEEQAQTQVGEDGTQGEMGGGQGEADGSQGDQDGTQGETGGAQGGSSGSQGDQDERREETDGAQGDSDESQGSEQQLLALEDAYRQAKYAYEDAVRAQETGMREAQRKIEDAKGDEISDNSGKISELDRGKLEQEKEKLEILLSQNGIVTSKVDGVVLEIMLETGNDTLDGKNMAIADLSSGSRFVAQITREQQKLVAVGSDIILKPADGSKEITGLKVNTIKENEEDSQVAEVTVLLSENQLEIGSSATMAAEKKTSDYKSTIPVEALRTEDRKYFVLVPEEKSTILGSELMAGKVYVEVLEKNDTTAALKEDSLFAGQPVIVSTSKPVKEGDRICLKEKTEE